MKPRHSDSLILAWQVAELEARHLRAEFVAPNHLLIGLCKMVDLDLPSWVAKDVPDRDSTLEELLREVRRLRTVFRTAGVDAQVLRRNLRRDNEGSHDVVVPKGRLHRTQPCKDVFADAEHYAELTESPVYPIHLLYAVMLSTDTERDAVMQDVRVDPRRLEDAAKREVLHRKSSADWFDNGDRN